MDKKPKVGDIYRWKELPDIGKPFTDGSSLYSTIDDGRTVFTQMGSVAYTCNVLDYWNGGKDDPNPRLKITGIWVRGDA